MKRKKLMTRRGKQLFSFLIVGYVVVSMDLTG